MTENFTIFVIYVLFFILQILQERNSYLNDLNFKNDLNIFPNSGIWAKSI